MARDTNRCKTLLLDLCGEHEREIRVLVMAMDERVAVDLLDPTPNVPYSIVLPRLAKRLHDNKGITTEFAQWAVESWALALGVIQEGEMSKPVTYGTQQRNRGIIIVLVLVAAAIVLVAGGIGAGIVAVTMLRRTPEPDRQVEVNEDGRNDLTRNTRDKVSESNPALTAESQIYLVETSTPLIEETSTPLILPTSTSIPSPLPSPSPRSVPICDHAIIVGIPSLSIREHPTHRSSEIRSVEQRKQIGVLCDSPVDGDGQVWVRVRGNDVEGWMSTQYLLFENGGGDNNICRGATVANVCRKVGTLSEDSISVLAINEQPKRDSRDIEEVNQANTVAVLCTETEQADDRVWVKVRSGHNDDGNMIEGWMSERCLDFF